MMVVPSAEHRPLKRQKLGPPDVYPQDAKQREDELDDLSVKQGFTHRPQIQDEYGSALQAPLHSSNVAENFNFILKKKAELNLLPDTGRKKQQINIKDNFWLVTQLTLRSKVAIEAWFKDLAGCKPLTSLAKKVPIFPKREDMLLTLCEYAVPIQRAIWFIKMTSFYHESKVAESKIKKRQQPDLSQDMTLTLTRFLREQLNKITDAYGASSPAGSTTPGGSTPGSSCNPPGSTPPGSSTPGSLPQPPHSSPHTGLGSSGGPGQTGAQLTHNLRNWNYVVQVALFMYQDGLLDRQELLEWVVDCITRQRCSEQDSALRVVLPLGLQYLDEIAQSEYLSRKLAYFSATKLTLMCHENGYNHAAATAASNSNNNSTSGNNNTAGGGGNNNQNNNGGNAVSNNNANSASAASGGGGNNNNSGLGGGSVNPSTPQPGISGGGVSAGASATLANGTSSAQSGGVAGGINPALSSVFQELLSCHQHRPVILALSAFIQAVTLDCSTALVWNNAGEKRNSWLCGSPLDQLPCAPSQLPMPPRYNNTALRIELRNMEEHLKQRSRAAKNRWSLDKYGMNITGWTTQRVLAALDALDRHSFDRVEAQNSLDTLYAKIFSSGKDSVQEGTGGSSTAGGSGGGSSAGGSGSSFGATSSTGPPTLAGGVVPGGRWGEGGVSVSWEEAVVSTVCQWAVSGQRCGEHRAAVAARLLDRRQSHLLAQAEASNTTSPYYSFQELLLKFLDYEAPVFDECKTSEQTREFGNLVLLFSELIRHDVFSHDGYMCTLISRGDLSDPPTQLNPPTATASEIKEEPSSHLDIDEDLDKILQNITKEAGATDSAGAATSGGHDSPSHHDLSSVSGAAEDGIGGSSTPSCRAGGATPGAAAPGSGETARSTQPQQPRHLIYAQHFPLPSDDSYAHEINQRYVLLYGVGKARDEARHAVKKLTKEILKLFSKKFSIDVAEGGKVKKSRFGEFNFESLLSRFSQLSFFDQHVITNNVAAQVIEMLSGCSSGSSNYLPLLDHIAFLMDLMETGLNIHGLLQLCCQLIKEILDIEVVLNERQCLVGSYCPQLTLLVMGVLRKYNKYLLVSQDQTSLVFEGLLRLVKHVSNPAECTSAERIVLSYLHSLYMSCSFIKAKHQESFSSTASRIKQALCSTHPPGDGKLRRNPHTMEDYITNPKMRLDMASVKQILSDSSNRFSFGCNAVIAIVNSTSNTRLNDIAVLCAEMTACCNALSSEWLGILNALCSSVGNNSGGSGSTAGSTTPGGNPGPYSDLVGLVDLCEPRTAAAAHASLSVFTAVLIARDCFSFEELLNRVVVHSLKAAWNNGKGNPEVEAGARLSCHLLLRIFQSQDSCQPAQYCPGSPGGSSNTTLQRSVRLSCDRHLLVAAHLSFSMEPVLAFLKAMLIVSDAMSGQSKTNSIAGSTSSTNASDTPVTANPASTGDADIASTGIDKISLSDFARYALRQICSQDWVREICLKCPEKLCNSDNLLDSILKPSQAQRVLHHICHPESNGRPPNTDQRAAITAVLQDLNEWRLRISWLDLHLMYEQLRGTPGDLNQWLDDVAHAAISVFCQQDSLSVTISEKARKEKSHSMNLISPLISKLPKAVLKAVLKVSSQVLNAVNFGAYSSHKAPVVPQLGALPGGGVALSGGGLNTSGSSINALGNQGSVSPHGMGSNSGCGSNGGGGSSSSTATTAQVPVHSHRPFLQLMLMCLEAAQDDTLSDLLESLRMQLMQPVTLYKELGRNRGEVDPTKRRLMLEALRLRFGLIGGLFDVITYHCSNVIITEWVILLVQLIVSAVIDLSNNSELFTTVLDMVAALVHSTLVADPGSDAREDNKRHYVNLVKKIKKEVGEQNNVSLRLMRQLITLPKAQVEVVVMEPWGSITDTKGNRHQDFDKDKKHGVQGAEKQKLSPWDLLEGHRSPAPLSWAWLAATRLTRKTLKYHDVHQLLRLHTHTNQRPLSYFLEPPPLPPEDLEPVPEKQVLLSQLPGLMKEEVKAPDTPSSEHSPRSANKRGGIAGATGGGKNPNTKKRKPKQQPAMPPVNQQQQPSMAMNFQQPAYSGVSTGPVAGAMTQVSQWGSNYPQQQQQQQQQLQQQQQQPQQQQQQPPYYQQLPPAGSTGAAPRYPVYSHSRNAIRQVLIERGGLGVQGQPVTPQQQQQFPAMGPIMNPHQAGPMIRQQIRGAMTSRGQQGGLYPGGGVMAAGLRQQMTPQPGQMYAGGQGGAGMGTYGAYQQGGMMAQGYQQQGYQAGPGMMGMRQGQQPGYLSQGQMVQRPPQYMQTTSGGGSLGMMSGGQAYARSGMGGLGGGAGGGAMAGAMGGGAMGSAAGQMGGAAGMGSGGGMGGASGGGADMSMHHRMMMAAPTTSTAAGQQQSQMMSHLQRGGMASAAQTGAGQQTQQQGGQQQQTGQQASQQQTQQTQRQTMMGQGRGYPQPPY